MFSSIETYIYIILVTLLINSYSSDNREMFVSKDFSAQKYYIPFNKYHNISFWEKRKTVLGNTDIISLLSRKLTEL